MTTSSAHAVNLQQLIEDSRDDILSQASAQQLSKIIKCSDTSSNVAKTDFYDIRLDSRQVSSNDVFVLLQSWSKDKQKSRDYLLQAAEKAAFILSEVDPFILFDDESNNSEFGDIQDHTQSTAQQRLAALPCPVVYVPTIRAFLGELIQARLQHQQPVSLPTVVAVTGTNGKTTISQLVAQLIQLTDVSSAVMGTAGNGKLDELVQASHTTGDALAVQQFLYKMGQQGAEVLALEASSHGLDQQRLQGMPIKVAVYTNLSRDHLDYHADMAEYAAAKAKLFDKRHFPMLTHAIINIDDDHAKIMLDTAHASGLKVWTYSLQAEKNANFVATKILPSLEGVNIGLRTQFADDSCDNMEVISPLLGRFNVANLLAAVAAVTALGVSLERIVALIPQLQGAIGRMQRVPSNDGCFIVDYAHTPDALSQVLDSLSTHCAGKLWAVFGCGGDRDAGKRPLMAQAGLAGADHVILTADNPRSEDPNAILQDMQAGMSAEQYQRTHIEPARQKAIAYAVTQAGADDIVVIAGKGHETYQDINGVRHDFDDSIVLQQALQQAKRI